MKAEVAEDFPALHACQHNRRIKCFLAWIHEMREEARLPFCLALVERHFQLSLPRAEREPHLEAAFLEYHGACSHYHDLLPPAPHCDRYAPGFVRADPQKCAEAIVQELSPLCGKPRKVQRFNRGFTRSFGDWTLFTRVEIRAKDGMVIGYSFLRRADAPFEWNDAWAVQHWPSRIDPIMLLGISGSDFPLVGQPHEALCAQSLRASLSMLLPVIPKLIEGL